MKKFEKFLSKEIEEHLGSIDFDTGKIDHTLRDITEDENFNIRLNTVIDKILDNINNQIGLVIDDIVEQIDCDALANNIANKVKNKIFTYKPNIQLINPVCDKCYRPYGEWTATSGGNITEQEMSKTGTRIIFIDDF